MAVSLAEIIIISLLVDWVFRKIKVPGLLGMIFVGIVLGPYVLGYMDPALLKISADLRLIAMIVILLRAGFELSLKTLQRVGRTVLLLAFIPASFEFVSITLISPKFLSLSYSESAILGAILSAVSLAVVVPYMISFITEKKGAEKGIPTLILAASPLDNVYVLVIFSILLGMYTGNKGSIAWKLASIPISVVLGILIGLGIGYVLYKLFDKYNPRATKRVLVILGISILLVRLEHILWHLIPFASLLSVITIGFIILEKREHFAHELSAKLARLWVFAEILLFTMVGAQVNVKVALHTGLAGAAVIGLGLIARSIGTYICLTGSNLTLNEKIFVVISYIPKATVQAAIGAAPLAAMRIAGMNTRPGEIILAVAVLSILLTAPLGAWAISVSGNKALKPAKEGYDDSLKAAIESEADVEEII